MNTFKNKKLTSNSQTLRKNMTRQERHLWYDFLNSLPITFHRQKVIDKYIVDFYCAKAKLVIELDGSGHYSTYGIVSDQERDQHLKSLGLTILRYSNLDVDKNFRGVCDDILKHINPSTTASGPPSPEGECFFKSKKTS